MKTVHDYDSMSRLNLQVLPDICEAYGGASIVQWYGNIERQLMRLLDDAEAGRNYVYADKLREYIKIWRGHEIEGSLNRDTLEILKASTDILAVDAWNLNNYFSCLRDQLRKLIASEEELPRVDMNQNEPLKGGGGMGGGRSMPPMSPEFGPEENETQGGLPPEGAPGEEQIPGGEQIPGEEQPPGEQPPPDVGGEAGLPPEEGGEEGEEEEKPEPKGRKMMPPPRARGI